jgi:hypothetical protein
MAFPSWSDETSKQVKGICTYKEGKPHRMSEGDYGLLVVSGPDY